MGIYPVGVDRYPLAEAALRAGVDDAYVARLIGLGLLRPGGDGKLSGGAIRQLMVIHALEQAGIPLDGLAQVVEAGLFSLDFIDAAGYETFAPLTGETFAAVAERIGAPVELLMTLREVTGGLPPRPADRMREDELAIVPLIELQLREGFRPRVVERALRVYADSLRRMAETEGEWWRSEVQERMIAKGHTESDVAEYAGAISPQLSEVSDRAVLAIYHAQQRLAWSVNIIGGIGRALERAGLHTRVERPPAMCFLDITGYTRLTQERGDTAAAALAEQVARLVERSAVRHRGRAVKWLGDGVMLYFPEPGASVVAALEIVAQVSEAGLPPAHVGIHAGPVLFQQGDFYGQTVNVAARIGEYARPGEVLVSQEMVDLATDQPVAFREIGPVELKGAGTVRLHQALARNA